MGYSESFGTPKAGVFYCAENDSEVVANHQHKVRRWERNFKPLLYEDVLLAQQHAIATGYSWLLYASSIYG
jgi:hypothetical protein